MLRRANYDNIVLRDVLGFLFGIKQTQTELNARHLPEQFVDGNGRYMPFISYPSSNSFPKTVVTVYINGYLFVIAFIINGNNNTTTEINIIVRINDFND